MTKTKTARTTMTMTTTTTIKSTSGQERSVGYLPMGGDEAKCGTMPSWQGEKGNYNEDDDDLSRQ
jgi:hypothetical protein